MILITSRRSLMICGRRMRKRIQRQARRRVRLLSQVRNADVVRIMMTAGTARAATMMRLALAPSIQWTIHSPISRVGLQELSKGLGKQEDQKRGGRSKELSYRIRQLWPMISSGQSGFASRGVQARGLCLPMRGLSVQFM